MTDTREADSDPEQPGTGLSAGAVALLRERLNAAASPAPRLDPERLAAYLCGALPVTGSAEVERALTQSAVARRMLLDARAEFDTLEDMPYVEAAVRAGALTGDVGEAARAWVRLVASGAGGPRRVRGAVLSTGLHSLREQAARGAAEARAAWRHLVAFGEQWWEAAQVPRMAFARGTEALGDADAVIEQAEVTPEGSLHVSASVGHLTGRQQADGTVLVLLLACGGQTCPVASAAVQGGHVVWEVPDLAAALGLPAGEVRRDLLAIEPAGTPVAPPPEVSLVAEVRDARSRPLPPVLLRVHGTPRFEAGRLHVSIAVPAETGAAHPTARLELRLRSTPRSRPLLGSWPISDWSGEPRMLAVATPDCPDAELPDCGLLAFRLRELPGRP